MFLYCIISRLVAHASKEDRIKRTRRTGAEQVKMPLKRGKRPEQLNVQHKGEKGGPV
jgi:hypothetical protein